MAIRSDAGAKKPVPARCEHPDAPPMPKMPRDRRPKKLQEEKLF